jgi:hypothetical protein
MRDREKIAEIVNDGVTVDDVVGLIAGGAQS